MGVSYASTLQYLIVDFPVSESLVADALDAACFTKQFYLVLNCSFCDT